MKFVNDDSATFFISKKNLKIDFRFSWRSANKRPLKFHLTTSHPVDDQTFNLSFCYSFHIFSVSASIFCFSSFQFLILLMIRHSICYSVTLSTFFSVSASIFCFDFDIFSLSHLVNDHTFNLSLNFPYYKIFGSASIFVTFFFS